MALQLVTYCANTKLSCAKTSCATPITAPIVICVDPEIVRPHECEEDVESPFLFHTIEGTLMTWTSRKNRCGNNCTTIYQYVFQYDDADLTDGQLLTQDNIEGVFCRGCLTQYIDDKAGDPVVLLANGNGQYLVNQYGCIFPIEDEVGGGGGGTTAEELSSGPWPYPCPVVLSGTPIFIGDGLNAGKLYGPPEKRILLSVLDWTGELEGGLLSTQFGTLEDHFSPVQTQILEALPCRDDQVLTNVVAWAEVGIPSGGEIEFSFEYSLDGGTTWLSSDSLTTVDEFYDFLNDFGEIPNNTSIALGKRKIYVSGAIPVLNISSLPAADVSIQYRHRVTLVSNSSTHGYVAETGFSLSQTRTSL